MGFCVAALCWHSCCSIKHQSNYVENDAIISIDTASVVMPLAFQLCFLGLASFHKISTHWKSVRVWVQFGTGQFPLTAVCLKLLYQGSKVWLLWWHLHPKTCQVQLNIKAQESSFKPKLLEKNMYFFFCLHHLHNVLRNWIKMCYWAHPWCAGVTKWKTWSN